MTKPPRRRKVEASSTPIRAALKESSTLHPLVRDGLAAIKNVDRNYFHVEIRASFADSLDIDEAFQEGREQEHRWDYLLGHLPSRQVIGVEPHSAHTSEISTVISKLEAAKGLLREHLRDGVRISKWLWVASGAVQFHPFEKAVLRLAQCGVEFAGRQITSKHIP